MACRLDVPIARNSLCDLSLDRAPQSGSRRISRWAAIKYRRAVLRPIGPLALIESPHC